MASITASIVLAGTPRPKPHSVTFSLKPFKPPQLHYFTTKTRLIHPWILPKPTISRCLRTSVRASNNAGRDRLPSCVWKRAMDAIDSSGRRATIGDVVSNSSLSVDEARKALQILAFDTSGFFEIGQCIALNGGVVTAEELAPYCDPDTIVNMDDVSYMLPVLLRFDSHPEVYEEVEDRILNKSCTIYHPTTTTMEIFYIVFHQYNTAPQKHIEVAKFLKEEKWGYCKLTAGLIRTVQYSLGSNLFWAMMLHVFLAVLSSKFSLTPWSSAFIFFLYSSLPLVWMYAIYVVLFSASAEIQWHFARNKNAKIVYRNRVREWRAKILESPDLSLKRKLSSARNMARQTSIGN